MADDLGDEWWVRESDGENKEIEDSLKENQNKKGLKKNDKKVKRKLEKSHKNHEKIETVAKKKKKKNKNIQQKEDKYKNAFEEVDVLWSYFEEELEKNLSSIEIGDLKPDRDDWFAYETNKKTNHQNIEEFSLYLQNVIPSWEKQKMKLTKKDVKASPLLLIVTSSAVRAVELLRNTSKFRGEKCHCSKLFAKHMKVNEQIEKLEKNIIHLGVGTPNRILKLIETEGLKLDHLKYLIVDWSWTDVKKRSIYTMPDVKNDFMKLFQTYFLAKCKVDKLKVGCF